MTAAQSRYARMTPNQYAGERIFLCGTRAVLRVGPGKAYRVVCATCGAGGSVPHMALVAAQRACIRDSNKPCRACGAS